MPSAQRMNFCRVMAAMALRYKDNVAIVNIERKRRYTFPEYHRLTNRIANMCRERLGLRNGDTAMLILDNDNFSLVHMPAIFKQEAAFVSPICAMAPRRARGRSITWAAERSLSKHECSPPITSC